MKKKYLFSVLAVMAMMCMCVFTACGGDDKDEDLPDGYVETTEGVHRIEVSFDGDLTGWEGRMMFVATYGTGYNVRLFKNGQLIADDGGVIVESLEDCSVETDFRCDQMNVGITLSNYNQAASPVKVTLRSFINGLPKKVKTVEFNESDKTIIFDSELDADIL
jgi:hypothetical protein